ncbi:MAG: hypothetical protein LC749_08690 [Actinobacteria bacterium]|nr:hypothetical protein [Actinomycetota bacterium]
MDLPEARIVVRPELSADELFGFYKRNNICEVGFGKEVAARILDHPHVIVAAFADQELVGLARATFDGLSAAIMEFSLDVRYQGRGADTNGSLMEGDPFAVGARLGNALLGELERLGSTFVSSDIFGRAEKLFYTSIGFTENEGHLVYIIDQRPYVQRKESSSGEAG